MTLRDTRRDLLAESVRYRILSQTVCGMKSCHS